MSSASATPAVAATPPRDTPNHMSAVSLGTGRSATAVSAKEYFTCALLDNDTVKCWGENRSGQLGLGDVQDPRRPAQRDGRQPPRPPATLSAAINEISVGIVRPHSAVRAVLDVGTSTGAAALGLVMNVSVRRFSY